jgi:hypothetical protein
LSSEKKIVVPTSLSPAFPPTFLLPLISIVSLCDRVDPAQFPHSHLSHERIPAILIVTQRLLLCFIHSQPVFAHTPQSCGLFGPPRQKPWTPLHPVVSSPRAQGIPTSVSTLL